MNIQLHLLHRVYVRLSPLSSEVSCKENQFECSTCLEVANGEKKASDEPNSTFFQHQLESLSLSQAQILTQGLEVWRPWMLSI